jgi:Holliday junction resolvasome RuvABC DNA-binding subunit
VADFAPTTQHSVASAPNEVLEALMFYGYSATEAASAIATIPTDKALSIEEQTLWALQYFAPVAEQRSRQR